jgi:hypothetical protein
VQSHAREDAVRRAIVVASVLSIAAVAHADVGFGPHDVATIFFIDKSDDHNRVDYGIHLDAQCHPASGSPMEVYWREFEGGRGGHVTHGLNLFEGPVYGVGSQRVVETRDEGATIDIDVRALSSRHLHVETQRTPSGCTARASLTIAGTTAYLDHVHLTLGDGPGSLRFADIYGEAVAGGAATHEHIVH